MMCEKIYSKLAVFWKGGQLVLHGSSNRENAQYGKNGNTTNFPFKELQMVSIVFGTKFTLKTTILLQQKNL
jgi:hypothetical protein